MWVDNIPLEQATLYITVAKAADMEFNFFGINILFLLILGMIALVIYIFYRNNQYVSKFLTLLIH